jgi:hypothetical protein
MKSHPKKKHQINVDYETHFHSAQVITVHLLWPLQIHSISGKKNGSLSFCNQQHFTRKCLKYLAGTRDLISDLPTEFTSECRFSADLADPITKVAWKLQA